MSRIDEARADESVTEADLDAKPTDEAPPPIAAIPASEAVTLREAPDPASLDPAARYQDVEMLGAGGMGEVALRLDDWIGREVACKTLRPARADSTAARAGFMREMRAQGQLEHPAIVPIYDFGVRADGRMYFTMRRVRGHTLRRILEGLASGDAELVRRYSRRKLLTAFVSAAFAVHYAHTRSVLHCDIKPSNIMLGEFGEVYVLDWGIAMAVSDARLAASEEPMGTTAGTPAYMAPEQMLGKRTLDGRTDVYALGLVLFEMLALRGVHQGHDKAEILEATLGGLDTRPSVHAADVPPELDAICIRATARVPEERFGTAEELAAAVERYLDGDRDLERRRQLAADHAARARAFAAEAGGSPSPDAMREVVNALSLDPNHAEARRTLVELLVKVPEEMPESVQRDMDRLTTATRRDGAKMAFAGFLTWLALVPIGVLNGVRSWLVLGISATATSAAAAYTAWMWRRGAVSARNFYAVAALHVIIVASLGGWLGPFVLIPTVAGLVTLIFSVLSAGRERTVLTLIGPLAVLIPFGLEAAHLVPPSFLVEDGRMVLLPRAYDLHPRFTPMLLLYTSLVWIVLPPVYMGRLRDALTRAQRQLFLHAWHFRSLLPPEEASREGEAAPRE